jgi:hypothetical protein
MTSVSLPDEVRAACAWVAERARSVRIEVEAIEEYAAGLPSAGEDEEPAPFAEEIELRAGAVQAVELLATTGPLTPAEIDSALWNRGRNPHYKFRPRPRSRNAAY